MPRGNPKTDQEFIEHFWSKVDKSLGSNGCWIWLMSVDSDGYGHIGRYDKLIACHRLAYKLTFGSIPEGKSVLHSCDNPVCVNPKHLFIGTQLINMQDCTNKGRRRPQSGENNSNATLRKEDIRLIREVYVAGSRNGEGSSKALSKRFGVTSATIQRIVNGKLWKGQV